MTFIIISIGARAQITDWADNVLIDTDNAVSPITDVWWLHGWDAAEPSSADWVARRELEQTQNILSPNYLHFPWDCLKCLILSSRGQTNGWPWILQSCSSDTGTDQLIRHWMPLKQVSAAQPSPDTQTLINWLDFSSDEARGLRAMKRGTHHLRRVITIKLLLEIF